MLRFAFALVLAMVPFMPDQAAAQSPQPLDRFITVNGLRLHYLERGTTDKPALILIHGNERHAHTFDHIAPEFTRDYRVIALDMRGHGESGWSPEAAYLVEDHVKDLTGLIEQLGLKRVTLWGNSTGGRVVQVYAGLNPGIVERVISEDVGPERPEDISSGFAKRAVREANGWASEDELVKEMMKRLPRTPEAIVRNLVRYGTRRRDDGRIIWKRDPNTTKGFVVTELWQYVSKITSPIVYVLGGASRIVPPNTQAKLKATIGTAEVVVMPGLGHYPNEEDTKGFLAIVNRFLKRG
jgi:pimeloyl-ACP methyl ester carboxylesterase